ncbi:hypothetical protein KR032_006849, partial [Drosophila birchii]
DMRVSPQLLLSDFSTVCPDSLMATLGFQIYKDLKNEEQSMDFQPEYDENLQVFYLLKEGRQAYVPVLHTKEIDFPLIQSLQEKLENITLFLAIVDNTANILYYQFGKGFCEKTI